MIHLDPSSFSFGHVHVFRAENGFLVVALQKPRSPGAGILSSLLQGIREGENPIENIHQAMSQVELTEKTARKDVEIYVTKTIEETLALLKDLLGVMSSTEKEA